MTYEPNTNPEAGAHQLTPLKGGKYETIIGGPQGLEDEIPPLYVNLEPIMVDGNPSVMTESGWIPNPLQAEMLTRGAHICLSVWQHPIPPLAVSVEPPVCECHDEPMTFYIFGDEESGFTCNRNTLNELGPTLDGDAFRDAKRTFEATDDDDGEDEER